MKKSLASLSLLALIAACPSPSIDSVDGLAGGALTSKLTAPAVAAAEVTADSIDVTDEVTAASVTSGAVTSSGPLTGSSVIVQRGADRVSFFGLVVGTTPQIEGEAAPDADGTTPNYAVRHQACASAFPATADGLPAAHVCTAQEAMAHVLQAPDSVPASASGGIVNSYAAFWSAAPDDQGTEQLVTDCGAIPSTTGVTGQVLRLHRRTSDGAWSLRVDTCAANEQLVCCQ